MGTQQHVAPTETDPSTRYPITILVPQDQPPQTEFGGKVTEVVISGDQLVNVARNLGNQTLRALFPTPEQMAEIRAFLIEGTPLTRIETPEMLAEMQPLDRLHHFFKGVRTFLGGALEYNGPAFKASIYGEPMPLTNLERKAFAALLMQPGVVVSKQVMAQLMWPNTNGLDLEHNIDVHVGNLRNKITRAGEQYGIIGSHVITTIRNVGYVFNDTEPLVPLIHN